VTKDKDIFEYDTEGCSRAREYLESVNYEGIDRLDGYTIVGIANRLYKRYHN